jgi:CDP-6-deoxy-D-xylo-4-hexulose-3-dehydrase
MYNWPLMHDTISKKDKLRMIKFILTAKKFTSNGMVKKFESDWSKWLGSKHSLFVSSGSTANFLLVAAIKEKYGLKNGDKVLLPACTWMTNVAPIIQLGLQPIFADINLKNYSFDTDDLKRIKSLHPDIKLIFVTHLLGFPANNNKYQEIFPDALIIDDVCESHGCKFDNQSKVGSNSLGATFSFYFGHHMTTIEGGMVSTNDTDLYDLMKMKRSHGLARESINFDYWSDKYDYMEKSFLFITDGYNFRNHEIPAVLGISQLNRLDKMIDTRRTNFEKYYKIVLNYSDQFYVPEYSTGNSSFAFPFIAKNKTVFDSLKILFQKNGIEYRPVVSGDLLRQPFLSSEKMASGQDYYNVHKLNTGLYIGNNHFVNQKNFDVLTSILRLVDG